MAGPRPPKILTRSRAWGCAAVNQLAFPGLGTVMAGRWTGYLQAALMLAGFCLAMGFMFWYFLCLARFVTGALNDEEFRSHYRQWLWALWSGGGLCVIAWCWSLVSSIAIVRRAAQ
ncbi:MAG: hypothetical protein L0Y58_05125 [Verrucomicrobia subdivision 3 bacterium]|nr:hypothetical protein [Limisphaerales bacterium]